MSMSWLGCRALVALMSAGDAESAAVLTPYNGQVRLIRSILKSKGGSLYDKVRMTRSSTPCPAEPDSSSPAGCRVCMRATQHACIQHLNVQHGSSCI